jgi:hypothetical protein
MIKNRFKMKLANVLLLVLAFSFTAVSNAQQNEEECKKFRSLAGEEIKMKNYKRAGEMYLKALEFCDACDAAKGNDIVYDNLKYAYEKMWKDEKDEARKKELADTVLWVYELRIKQCTEVSDKWMASYGYFLGKSKINYEKAATLLGDYLRIKEEKAGLNYIATYYKSVYYTYKKTKLNSWRDTLINKYFVINDWLEIIEDDPKMAKYVPKIRSYVEDVLMGKILKDCDEISNVLETKVGQFADMTKESKLDFCVKAIELLDKKKCVDEPVYAKIIEVYIELLPDSLVSEGAYKYAKYLESKKQYKEANVYYDKAILKNNNPENNDMYKAGKVRVIFRLGNYKACFSLAKSVNGEYRGASLKIAAQCIAQTANGCGVSTIERKANYYLALDYLGKAEAAGASVGGLRSSYKKNCPSKEEKFKESWKDGKSITLSCWGEATTVRATD